MKMMFKCFKGDDFCLLIEKVNEFVKDKFIGRWNFSVLPTENKEYSFLLQYNTKKIDEEDLKFIAISTISEDRLKQILDVFAEKNKIVQVKYNLISNVEHLVIISYKKGDRCD